MKVYSRKIELGGGEKLGVSEGVVDGHGVGESVVPGTISVPAVVTVESVPAVVHTSIGTSIWPGTGGGGGSGQSLRSSEGVADGERVGNWVDSWHWGDVRSGEGGRVEEGVSESVVVWHSCVIIFSERYFL